MILIFLISVCFLLPSIASFCPCLFCLVYFTLHCANCLPFPCLFHVLSCLLPSSGLPSCLLLNIILAIWFNFLFSLHTYRFFWFWFFLISVCFLLPSIASFCLVFSVLSILLYFVPIASLSLSYFMSCRAYCLPLACQACLLPVRMEKVIPSTMPSITCLA